MTQQTNITDENGRVIAEVRDSEPNATARALVVRVVGLLSALAPIANGATEGTLADALNELIALRAGRDLDELIQWLELIATQQSDESQRTAIVGGTGSGTSQAGVVIPPVGLGLPIAGALAVGAPTEIGGIGFQSSVTTNANIAIAVGRRVQRIHVIGAAAGVQPTVTLNGTFGFTAQPVPRSTLLTLNVLGRHSNGGVNVLTTNTTYVGVETTG
ncbi:MAG: hypothetical protein U0269_30720 [Polyangiales bacterium]